MLPCDIAIAEPSPFLRVSDEVYFDEEIAERRAETLTRTVVTSFCHPTTSSLHVSVFSLNLIQVIVLNEPRGGVFLSDRIATAVIF